MRKPHTCLASVALLVLSTAVPAAALPEPADLTTWQAETYPGDDVFAGPGVWQVAPDGSFVVEGANGSPTLFVSDRESTGQRISVTFTMPANDDDFVGMALGFSRLDSADPDADFLLLDWKRSAQLATWNGIPTPSAAGLAVSRVTGVPLHAEFWGHFDAAMSPGSVHEIVRGSTLGSTGWVPGASHVMVVEYRTDRLQVWVDDILQLDVGGEFPTGPFALYDFSQPGASFSNITFESLNRPPSVGDGGAVDVSAPEGSVAETSGHFVDPDGDPLELTCTGLCDGFVDGGDGTWTWSAPILDDLPTETVTIVADDGTETASDHFTVTGTNVPPAIASLTGPIAPVPVGDAAMLDGTFSDAGTLDTHTVTIDWGDGTVDTASVDEVGGAGSFAATHVYGADGVHVVSVTLVDDDGGVDQTTTTIEVFDPNDFVTGGGWVTSPSGALVSDPDHSGKATFGFVVRHRGSRVTGNMTLQIHNEAMVKATSFDSLRITDGVAVFTGTAELDGEGTYDFTVVATDERLAGTDSDTFWITITRGPEVVYGGAAYPPDGLPIKGRGIQVHDR